MKNINVWALVMVAALLSLALANAFINILQQAWADLSFSLAMILLLVPLPQNLRFISQKLASKPSREASVKVLHSLASVAFLGGMVVKFL